MVRFQHLFSAAVLLLVATTSRRVVADDKEGLNLTFTTDAPASTPSSVPSSLPSKHVSEIPSSQPTVEGTEAPTVFPGELCDDDISGVDYLGFKTLRQLNVFMDTDYINVIRNVTKEEPPYVYYLCPNTVFDVAESRDSILPQLDNTIISCGWSGRVENNCTLREVSLSQDSFATHPHIQILKPIDMEYERRQQVSVRGLTFTGSKAFSIAAWDRRGTSISFIDCKWTQNTGKVIISNFFRDISNSLLGGPENEDAMLVSLENCTIVDNNLLVEEPLEEEKMQENVEEGLLYTFRGSIELKSTIIADNSANDIIFASGASISVVDTTFDNNTVAFGTINARNSDLSMSLSTISNSVSDKGSTIFASDSLLDISFSDFIDNEGQTDLALDSEANTTMANVRQCCFIGGAFELGPVVVESPSSWTSSNNHASQNVPTIQDGNFCENGAYYVTAGLQCLRTNTTSSSDVDCKGSCFEFSAGRCEDQPDLTSEPTVSPTTATPTQTPTDRPSWAPDSTASPTPLPTAAPATNEPTQAPTPLTPLPSPMPTPAPIPPGFLGSETGFIPRPEGRDSFCGEAVGVCITFPFLAAFAVFGVFSYLLIRRHRMATSSRGRGGDDDGGGFGYPNDGDGGGGALVENDETVDEVGVGYPPASDVS